MSRKREGNFLTKEPIHQENIATFIQYDLNNIASILSKNIFHNHSGIKIEHML